MHGLELGDGVLMIDQDLMGKQEEVSDHTRVTEIYPLKIASTQNDPHSNCPPPLH